MTIALLLVTHPGIGSAMQAQVSRMLGQPALYCECTEVLQDDDPELSLRKIQRTLDQAEPFEWILLTDIFGATPSNLALKANEQLDLPIIHGLNLPMLLRAHNYASLPRSELVEKIISGGRQAIFSDGPS